MSEIYRTAEEIEAACSAAINLAPAEYPADLPAAAEVLGEPAWHPFEHAAWPIGESLRRSFKECPRLKRNPAATAATAAVIECRNLRRGRQSFVMAIGFKAAAPLAGRVAAFLSDPDIQGHVVDALVKMRAGGYARQVWPLVNADRQWIRRLARRYVTRYGAAA